MTMFIHFFCLCPLSLTMKLNFNISKVAYRQSVASLKQMAMTNPVLCDCQIIITMIQLNIFVRNQESMSKLVMNYNTIAILRYFSESLKNKRKIKVISQRKFKNKILTLARKKCIQVYSHRWQRNFIIL